MTKYQVKEIVSSNYSRSEHITEVRTTVIRVVLTDTESTWPATDNKPVARLLSPLDCP